MKWGILGSGNIAKCFLKAKVNEVVAIAGQSKEKSLSLQKEFSIPVVYDSYGELIKSDVDAVYIALPHGFHYKYALEAMDEGKAVLIEKPMALNEWEVQSLILKAKEKNVLLMEAMKTRYFPAYQELKKALKQGIIGELQSIQVSFCSQVETSFFKKSYLSDAIQGGVLLDVGCYVLNYLVDLLGTNIPLKKVDACFKEEVDVDVLAIFERSGVSFQMELSLEKPSTRFAILKGNEGMLEIPNFHRPNHFILKKGKEEKVFEYLYEGNDLSAEIRAFEKAYALGLREEACMPWLVSQQIAHELDRVKDAFTADPDASVYRM
ncbi:MULTISPECIES: Gfo/Idh/MocA family protein [Terrabacteria group]|uniref:Gfo/Idh/MocA family protein n=1 Tax=Bacillati TaxID=1783272 RepID=UPI001C6E214F|nr:MULTISPECIES: Gfo/Idh/MocA family oxidoreductase [Terrabacteria group]MBW9211980.1 Gfo/Idh/MocA family oxidoreductase [Trueperella sp. zg.1013]